MKKIFNLEMLVSIHVCDKRICKDIVYLPFKKNLFKNRKEGFYLKEYFGSINTDVCLSKNQLENGKYNNIKFLVIENIVYYRPYVELCFLGEHNIVEKFNSIDEAVIWSKEKARKSIKISYEFNDEQ